MCSIPAATQAQRVVEQPPLPKERSLNCAWALRDKAINAIVCKRPKDQVQCTACLSLSRNLSQATSTHFFHPVLVKSGTISKLLESLRPPLPPHNQSWERNRGGPAIAQMALHFTRACVSQNALPTLTARGEGAGSTTGQVLKSVLISQTPVPQECSNKRR